MRHTLALRPALTPPYAHKIFLRQIGEILDDVQAEVERWQGGTYPATVDVDASDWLGVDELASDGQSEVVNPKT